MVGWVAFEDRQILEFLNHQVQKEDMFWYGFVGSSEVKAFCDTGGLQVGVIKLN